MTRRGLLSLGSVLILVGCGSSNSSRHTYTLAHAKPPTCAHAGRAIDLPPGFPPNFPFPDGTSITSSGKTGVATTIAGIVPTPSFRDTAAFFASEVAKAGFTVVYSEADPPRDAEGSFRGKGYAGRWTLEHLESCPRAIRLKAFAQPERH